MATRAKRLAESWSYVPREERALPAEQQTTFRLTPLSQSERLAANDEIAITTLSPAGVRTTSTRERLLSLRLCVEHIEEVTNFPVGEKAEPWPVEWNARERYLDALDDELVREVGNEIFTRSTIGELEKNS